MIELHETDLIDFVKTNIYEHGEDVENYRIATSYDVERIGFWVILTDKNLRVLYRDFMPYCGGWDGYSAYEEHQKIVQLGLFARVVFEGYWQQKLENERKKKIIFGGR